MKQNDDLIDSGTNLSIGWMTFEDLPFLIEVRNACRFHLHDDKKVSLHDSVQWWQQQDPMFMIIQLHKGNIPVGYIRTSHLDMRNKRVMIGLDIHPDHRRQGYATEAYQLLLHYLFYRKGLHKVALEVLANNTGAIAMYDKLGFTREGIKRDEILRNGQYIDSIIMSILREEYVTH